MALSAAGSRPPLGDSTSYRVASKVAIELSALALLPLLAPAHCPIQSLLFTTMLLWAD